QDLTIGVSNGQDGIASFAGVITSAGGGLIKTGTGTQILSGTNTYRGTTTINGGTLQVGAGGTSGSLGSGLITINSNGTLRYYLDST
ncbi:autotransporter-associated beta strand repeat-containing protein, partial [Acinetobacter baumannii]